MTADEERAAIVEDHPKDVCDCGDYREQHRDGTGPCVMNRPGDMCHGFRDCLQFTLWQRAHHERNGHEVD